MNTKGFSLIEMLIGMALFGIMMTGIYATFITFQQGGYREIKRSKEGLRESVAKFRINKIIQSAGFGIRQADHSNAVVGDNGSVVIFSLLGDSKYSGQWEVYPDNVTIPTNLRVSLNEDREDSTANGSIAFRCKDSGEDDTCDSPYYYYVGLKTSSVKNGDSTNVDYQRNCGPDSYNLLYKRSATSVGQPLLYCVADFRFEYGYEANGNIVWDSDTTTLGRDINDLKLIRVGYIIQSGKKTKTMTNDTQLTYATFQTNNNSINLADEMRYYRWEIIEELIPMTNL